MTYAVDTTGNVNQYDTIGGQSLSYDTRGNLTVDEDGYQYFYDYENRITQIKDSSNAVVVDYTYDALGRRIQKDDGTVTRYYYDGQRVLLETDGSQNDQRAYVYGNYIDEVLVMTDYTAQDDPDYFYGQDHLYSAVVLFSDAGAVVERYEYDAYGNVRIMDASYNSRTGSSYGNCYLFTGRRLDTLDEEGALKIYYYRARYYDPETGRFLQRDPVGADPSELQGGVFGLGNQYLEGLSLYQYVRSQSVGKTDPHGLKLIWPLPIFFPETECEKIKAEYRQKIEDKVKELLSSVPYVSLDSSMPYRHCFWNCMMVINRGRKYAERMSRKKEELDNLYADKGIKLIEAGCWGSLTEREKKECAEAARSADQPSDLIDNETGRICGESVVVKLCPMPFVPFSATYRSAITGSDVYSSDRAFCRACCTQMGVGPGTPDGPGAGRRWGDKSSQFPPEYSPPIVY